MNRKEHIEKKIGETMDSLDGMSRAVPTPFLFTRIEARMAATPSSPIWDAVVQFIARPYVAIAAILLVILLNTVAVFEIREAASAPREGSVSDDYAAVAPIFLEEVE